MGGDGRSNMCGMMCPPKAPERHFKVETKRSSASSCHNNAARVCIYRFNDTIFPRIHTRIYYSRRSHLRPLCTPVYRPPGIVNTTQVSCIYLSFGASIRIWARVLRHIIHSAAVPIETQFMFGLWLRLSSRLLERASLASVRVTACL